MVVSSIDVMAGDFESWGKRGSLRKPRCTANFGGEMDRLVDLVAVGVQVKDVPPVCQVFGGE